MNQPDRVSYSVYSIEINNFDISLILFNRIAICQLMISDIKTLRPIILLFLQLFIIQRYILHQMFGV